MKTNIKRRLFTLCASALYVLTAGHPVLADDTEVLIGPGGQAWATPNVLFVMDTSGSMGDDIAGNTPTATNPSRLSIVQDVFSNLMTNNSGFNVALMRFDSSGEGGYFVTPMQELNASTRATIIAASNAFIADGRTPLSETFYEAARFYSGMSVDYGDSSNPDTNHSGVFNGSNYISPITSECQKNYTILLTDGVPTSDTSANTNVQNDFLGGTACTGSGDGRCLDDIAEYLYTTDQSSGPNGIPGTQTVETYTIGFTTNQALLEATAMAGGGTSTPGGGNDHYITANNAAQLSAAFTSILGTITDTNNSFSPPAMAANSFDGISHFNRMYFSLFEPAAMPKWVGNVKPYTINDNYELEDADGNTAIDANGFFRATSRSFWSLTDDGDSIVSGGANGQLPGSASRNLYTYTGNYGLTGSYNLSDGSNALENSVSSNLTPALLNMSNPNPTALNTAFDAVIDTVRAAPLGAPLHSQPALVTYGGTESSPELTLFIATNDGFLHAINASTGVEEFAFIPQELLPNLPILTGGTGSVVYGLDGAITTWVKESNDADHTIEVADNDHVYVYVGMRRGGSNYYALDVTDKDAPELKWVIKGGAGGTPGFEELGQSWSKPTLTTISYGSGTRDVLVFGGGYDTAQDANPLNNVAGNEDTIGRAVFIVDADTGALLWSAGPSGSSADLVMADLTHSIPSDVRLLDSDLDGHTDRMYVGDMRGQVFRFDLQASASGVTGSGTVLAELGGSTEADNRRFYYPPDVVVTQNDGAAPYVSVNIGSGYRAHPLNPLLPNGTVGDLVNDRFYSLRDPEVLGAASGTFTTITNSSTSLLDITNLPVLSSANTANLNSLNGWYITLGNSGEKVLAPAITVNGEIFFTTYVPPGLVAATNCAPPPGTGYLYRVSLFDGSPVTDQNGDSDTEDTEDRIKEITVPGIPPGPTAMFREDSNGDVEIVHCEGTECDALPNAIQIQESYWQDDS